MGAEVTAQGWLQKPVISGIGQSQIGRRLERSSYQLSIDAILAAIDDAGLQPSDIDGLATYPGPVVEINPGFNGADLYEVQDGLGFELNWHMGVSQGPAQFMSVFAAATAVSAGLCKHAVVYRTTTEASAQSGGKRRGHDESVKQAEGVLGWLLAAGTVTAVNWTAFYMHRHMQEYGTTKEHLGWVATTVRDHASRNPDAVFREPLTMDEYLAARMISSPLSLYDCDITLDGSMALIISATDTKDDLRQWVGIEAVGSAMRHRPYWEHWPDLTTMATHDAAAHMWSQTDLKPSDVDTAQLYDAFSPFALFWLEAMGFCAPGESGPFVEGGTRIGLGGELPLNTFGGQLSAGRLHGWGYLVEAIRQLRDEAGARQVHGANVVVLGVGGGASAAAMLLTRGRTAN